MIDRQRAIEQRGRLCESVPLVVQRTERGERLGDARVVGGGLFSDAERQPETPLGLVDVAALVGGGSGVHEHRPAVALRLDAGCNECETD